MGFLKKNQADLDIVRRDVRREARRKGVKLKPHELARVVLDRASGRNSKLLP